MKPVDREGLLVIREFYEESAQALFTYALALTRCPETAEDAVHDAVCRLLERRALPAALRPYAFRCVRNAAIDARRRRRPAEPLGILDLERCDDASFSRALFSEIERLLFGLPQDEMEAVVLRLVDGLTFREIAEVKQAPQNTVASWYRRGLARLRECVGEDGTCASSKTL